MVPFEAFSTDEPQSSSAFCNGCDGGTQCAILSSNVLSCAIAVLAARLKAAPSAKIFNRIEKSLPADIFAALRGNTSQRSETRQLRLRSGRLPSIISTNPADLPLV